MDEKTEIISPARPRGSSKPKDANLIYKVVLGVVLIVIIAGASFAGGVSYQKDHSSTSSLSASNGTASSGGGFGGSFGRRDRVFGSVTAISATSITVQSNFGSASPQTFAITSSTTITSDGQSAAASSISVGATVIVTISSSNSSDASAINVNPSFGGQGPTSSSSTTQSQSL